MKYRKKPVVIEAWQFTDENKNQLLHDLQSQNAGIYPAFDDDKPVIRIPTLEGEMTASLGDYIIKGVSGEFYPCKPDIFEQTYDEAGDYKHYEVQKNPDNSSNKDIKNR